MYIHGNAKSEDSFGFSDRKVNRYLLAAENLIQFASHQALGFPNGAHALFTR